MKKLYVLLIPLFALLLFFGTSLSVRAEEGEEYILTGDAGTYTLSVPDGSEPVLSASIDELFNLIPAGSHVRFDSVSLSAPLTLTRELTLSGSLSSTEGVTVKGGAVLTLDGLTVALSGDGVLDVWDGRVYMVSGLVSHSDGTAVRLAGVSSSFFSMTGGRVSTLSSSPAIYLERGSTELLGGHVDNTAGVPVETFGTLTVGGSVSFDSAVYDIISSGELYVSSDVPFGGTLSVKLQREFEKGGLYPVVWGIDGGRADNITVYDSNGAPRGLTFFENGGDGYLAVYLPYNVTYISGGVTVYTEELLSGMTPTAFPIPEREGYTAGVWCTDGTLSEEYNFAEAPTADLTLYASYTLAAPTFSLLSADTVYDGREHTVTFSELSHPLDGEGFYSFAWEGESGETLSFTSALTYRSVSDSGKYRCRITFTVGRDSVSVVTPYITVTVSKMTLTPPENLSTVYTGSELIPDIDESALYTASYDTYTNAGEYLIPVTLTDPENYAWQGAGGDTVYVGFSVLRAENAWLTVPYAEWVYSGETLKLFGNALFGSVAYRFWEQGSEEYLDSAPDKVGVYYVVAEVAECENYTGLSTEPFLLEIREDIPVALSVETQPNVLEYRAFDYFKRDGLSFLVTYESGQKITLGAESVSVFYQTDNCLRFGDTAVIAEYRGVRVAVPVTVVKREYDITFTLESVETVYDGTYKTYPFDKELPVGLDGIPLRAFVAGGGTDAGEYVVEIRFTTDSLDYESPAVSYSALIINPAPATVVWDRTVFVYDGTVMCPRAKFTDVFGASVSLTVTGGAIMAKDGYIAVAATDNANYSLRNYTTEYNILKADLDLSGLRLSSDSFVYDGTVKTVALEGLPLGVTVVGYTDNRGCDAGEYKLSCVLSFDSANYNEPPPLEFTWYIERAPYDTSGFSFTGGEFVYDGTPHLPTLNGSMPTGLDGIPLTFTYGDGVTDVGGAPVVEVVFSTESTNYYPPSKLYVPITVIPRGFTVVWYGTDFVYDGMEKQPYAIGEYPTYVIGAAIDAGEYTARAVSVNKNYYVINSDVSYKINKKMNSLTSELTVGDVFVGTPPSPEATAEYGEPSFVFYRDSALTVEVTPTAPGLYYVRAYVAEGANYLPFFSEAASFSVIDIVPVRLDITMKKSVFSAFDRVGPDDFSAKLAYNDGSVREVDTRQVAVQYREGDCLLVGDGGVNFTCLGVAAGASVTVEKISYDMSGAVWSNTVAVYDGTAKLPTLSGLPEGVALLSLSGAGTNAGQYTVIPAFSYDERNYEPPTLSPCTLIIEKQKITPTLIGGLVYNGELQLPTPSSPLYRVVNTTGFRDAGSYYVELAPVDPNNYELSGETVLEFVILPSELTVMLADEDVYLFEEPRGNGYAVVEGSIAEGEELNVSYCVLDGKLYATSDNANYRLTVIPGNINYVPRPSPAVSRALFLCFLLAVALMLLLVFAAKRREDIRGLLLAVKERCLAAPVTNAALPSPTEIPAGGVDVTRADGLISDGIAKTLIRREGTKIYTQGRRRAIINVDTLSESFSADDVIDINVLKARGLVPEEAGYLKVLARGAIDKPLKLYANAFSLSAVKMIALTGGEANKVATVHEKRRKGEKNYKGT